MSPKLLYAVVLRPNMEDLSGTQRFTETHHSLRFPVCGEKEQHEFAKRWALCPETPHRFITPPLICVQLDGFLMFREFGSLMVNLHDVVAFTVDEDGSKP